MATKVLPGGITRGVRKIRRPTHTQVHFDRLNNDKPSLTVIEHGDTRTLPISRAVAEVLVARGMAHGN